MPVESDWREARLRSVADIADDIRLFDIEPGGWFEPPPPGSHISVAVRIGERPDTRSYSVVGPCRDSVYRIAVKRMPQSRGGSAYLWSLAPGARLSITPPRNLFPLAHGRPQYLLVAGGIGITPIYSMALALAEKGADFCLLYGCRSRGDLAFADELRERIGDRLVVAVEEEGQRPDLPGAVAALAPDGELYVCGPIGLLDAVRRLWRDSGRPAANLRFETFGNTGRFAAEPFTVRIPRLGLEVQVPQNRTMLDALEAAGVAMISDCRRGECGLCTVKVLEVDGALDHRDVFFSDRQKDEGKRMCTCVSRAVQGGITIDTADRSA